MCPFLDRADPCCATHQSLQDLEYAMGRCGHLFEECPVYQRLSRGHARQDKIAESVRAAG